jgi:WD40 repeat protein
LKSYESKEKYLSVPSTVKHKVVVHNSECTAIAFNTFGDAIATAGADQSIKFWGFEKLNQISSIKYRNKCAACQLAFSHDNQLFMAASTDHKATIYSIFND